MAGVFVKGTNGIWKRALAGGSGFGSVMYQKRGGVWRPAFGNGTGTSAYVKVGGVWAAESAVTPP